MISIKNKTALVTGASSGIGKETVKLLLSEGAVVYAAARRVERMKELEEAGAIIIKMDVTEEKSLTEGINSILKVRDSIDILVNNAGYGFYGALEDVEIKDAKHQFEVNVFGLTRLTQLVLPGMRKNSYGKIINISSMAGKIYAPFGGWYFATKHALEALTDCLRLEVQPFGIDAVLIEPGGIDTEWGIIAADNLMETSRTGPYADKAVHSADKMKELYSSSKLTHPEKIAKVILKSITVRRPKTRYAAGYGAKISLWLRRYLPDRWFDKLSLSMLS